MAAESLLSCQVAYSQADVNGDHCSAHRRKKQAQWQVDSHHQGACLDCPCFLLSPAPPCAHTLPPGGCARRSEAVCPGSQSWLEAEPRAVGIQGPEGSCQPTVRQWGPHNPPQSLQWAGVYDWPTTCPCHCHRCLMASSRSGSECSRSWPRTRTLQVGTAGVLEPPPASSAGSATTRWVTSTLYTTELMTPPPHRAVRRANEGKQSLSSSGDYVRVSCYCYFFRAQSQQELCLSPSLLASTWLGCVTPAVWASLLHV